uniref:Uncharacterized protein n=1 Tax=Glossina pallidipes TaxID=7398 RepID=A0A1A9ZWA7_GLOPL
MIETLLVNTDKQLENLEKLATGIKYAPVEMKIVDALKHGNEALKNMVDINEIERIMDETRGDTNVNESDVSTELDALVAKKEAEKLKLSEVPQGELSLPSADETLKEGKAAIKEKPKKILIEA